MTTPARSLPCPDGKLAGNNSSIAPERIAASPGFDARRTNRDDNLPKSWFRHRDIGEVQHVNPAIAVELHGPGMDVDHEVPRGRSRAETEAGLAVDYRQIPRGTWLASLAM
jgi:hypothetical protein